MRKSIGLLILLFFFSAQTGLAASKINYDQDYDFKQIKKIVLFEPLFVTSAVNAKEKAFLTQALFAEAKLKNVRLLSSKQVQLAVQADEGIDFALLAGEQPELVNPLLLEYLPQYADAAIYVTVRSFDEGSVYVEASTYTETKYETYPVYDSKGNRYEHRYPVTKTYTVPAHYKSTFSVKLDFRVVDSKTGNDVFWQSEYRYREYIKSKNAVNMYKRAVKNFFQQLQKRF